MALFPKYLLSALFGFLTLSVEAEENTSGNKLPVTVYYESLCPDSIRFIRDQLLPSMVQKGRFNDTDLKWYPYGHVVQYNDSNNQKVLRCQHGRKECELNAQHACIIESNTEKESLDMITCLMSGYNKKLDNCAEKHEVNLDKAKSCKDTRTIADILGKYGEATYALNPSFIPAISIDGVFKWDDQDDILSKFDKVFCRKYEEKYNKKLDGC